MPLTLKEISELNFENLPRSVLSAISKEIQRVMTARKALMRLRQPVKPKVRRK